MKYHMIWYRINLWDIRIYIYTALSVDVSVYVFVSVYVSVWVNMTCHWSFCMLVMDWECDANGRLPFWANMYSLAKLGRRFFCAVSGELEDDCLKGSSTDLSRSCPSAESMNSAVGGPRDNPFACGLPLSWLGSGKSFVPRDSQHILMCVPVTQEYMGYNQAICINQKYMAYCVIHHLLEMHARGVQHILPNHSFLRSGMHERSCDQRNLKNTDSVGWKMVKLVDFFYFASFTIADTGLVWHVLLSSWILCCWHDMLCNS